jgi:hypothetical protein
MPKAGSPRTFSRLLAGAGVIPGSRLTQIS